jgi:hypothetical protein
LEISTGLDVFSTSRRICRQCVLKSVIEMVIFKESSHLWSECQTGPWPERFRRLQPQRTPMGTERGKRCGLSGRIRTTKREPHSDGKSVRLSLGYPCSRFDPWFQRHYSGLEPV